MSWFRRRINRWRNLMSDSDYAGSHGGGSSTGGSDGPSQSTQSTGEARLRNDIASTHSDIGPTG